MASEANAAATPAQPQPGGMLPRVAHALTAFAERYIPDAYVFALLASAAVAVAAFAALLPEHGAAGAVGQVFTLWGGGVFDLLPFTMQMALVVVTGTAVASSPVVARGIRRLASWPRTDRGAVAMVVAFAMVSSWINWGFSLVVSALLAREVARVRPQMDYRTLAAASFLGLGSVWAQGLSGSAALQMATAAAIPPALRDIVAHGGVVESGLVPLSSTIFLWQSFVAVAIEIVVVTALIAWALPVGAHARTAADLGIALAVPAAPSPEVARVRGFSDRLEHSRAVSAVFVVLGVGALWMQLRAAPTLSQAMTLNTLNLLFLTLAVAAHGTPARLQRAVVDATTGTWGIILQFPLYAGLAALITKTTLSARIAALFVAGSSHTTFPAVVALYSAALGVLVPSGGGKWVIEAPYIIAAAHAQQVHLGLAVTAYDLGEALANLLQPFWMVPVLAVFGLRARDVMGVTLLVFLVLCPLVLALVTLIGFTLSYPL